MTQRNIGVWLALGLIVVIVGLDLVGGGNAELLGLLVSPPILAASFVGPKRTVAVGVVALAAAVGYGRAVGVDLLAGSQGVPVVAIGVATVLSGVVARVRVEREGRLRAVTRVAEVAQRALLGGVPPALGSLRLAVLYASASAEASIGGDFYEALETPHGVRLLVGDVRGKGLDAVRLAGVVLGSFRDAAQDRPDLAQVTAALDRSVTRAIGPEDFVTAVLVQVDTDGSAIVVNCGHPAPLLVRGGRATELDPPEPAPPLGLGPRPEPLRLTVGAGRPDLAVHRRGERGTGPRRVLPLADRGGVRAGQRRPGSRAGDALGRAATPRRWAAPRRRRPAAHRTQPLTAPTSPQADGPGPAAQLEVAGRLVRFATRRGR